MKALVNRLIAAGIRRHERAMRIRRLKGQLYACMDCLADGLNKNNPSKVMDGLIGLSVVASSTDPYEVLNLPRPIPPVTQPYPSTGVSMGQYH